MSQPAITAADVLRPLPSRSDTELAFLARTGLGEIVIRRKGKFVGRMLFPTLWPCPHCAQPYDGEHCSVCLDGCW